MVYDDQGKEYIEGLAGLWCTSFGFGEEELIEAAVEQMRKLPSYHAFAHKTTGVLIDLAEKLKEIAPAAFSKVFFVCSGSEANDSQLKLLWYYNNARGRPQKKKVISRIKGYHGVTIAAASMTGLPANHRDFDLPIPQVKHAANPHHYREAEAGESEEDFSTRLAAMLEQQILDEGPDTVAAFIAEPRSCCWRQRRHNRSTGSKSPEIPISTVSEPTPVSSERRYGASESASPPVSSSRWRSSGSISLANPGSPGSCC